MNTVALIPLRAGSISIPKKNIKSLCGKPLCAWVLEAACGSKSIKDVFVSTDCPEISAVVEELGLGINIIQRPAEFATATASTESVMLHFMREVSFDNVVTIQATSPLLTERDLDAALINFKDQQFD